MIEQQKNEVWLTPNKWSYEERRLHIFNGTRFFEKNYSKWATFNINKFEDIKILGTFSKGDYFYKKGDYKVSLSGDSHLEEAQDTMYESWCGNLEVRKQFKDCMEKDEYFELEAFLENEGDFKITDVQSDLQFNIPKEDYLELKKIFN